jgi:hypothetical protein
MLPRISGSKDGSRSWARLRPDAYALCDDDAMRPRAPAATDPIVYVEHYTARAAACSGYHIGSLQELLHTICDPVVPPLVALYDPQ